MAAHLHSAVLEAAVECDAANPSEALTVAAAGLSPWQIVDAIGWLARARWARAREPGALSSSLRRVDPQSPSAVVVVREGQLVPHGDLAGRRARGAFDTSPDLARRAVHHGLRCCPEPGTAWDPACGTGALLVAMVEAGIAEVRGSDVDPLALHVARLAAPEAVVFEADLLGACTDQVDLVVGNPPFVSPERQDKALRARLRQAFPWLKGRFDLAVPCAEAMLQRVRTGGGCALILPSGVLVQRYGESLRRRWVEEHRLVHIGAAELFPGASVEVHVVGLQRDAGPCAVGEHSLDPDTLLELPLVPLHAETTAADLAMVERIRAASRTLGEVMRVDTGVVAHGPDGGKERLLRDAPEPGCVPFADARDFFAGRRRWLSWEPERMHRPKDADLFEPPKLVVQRIRGRQPTRAQVDRDGVYVGHTCTVAVPTAPTPPLERLAALIASPLVAGMLRLERGAALDLYPHAVAAVPVPRSWWETPMQPLEEAWGLSASEVQRLEELASA